MFSRVLPLFAFALFTFANVVNAKSAKPEIAAATVEDSELSTIIRLVVTPDPEEDSFRTVCNSNSIRVRLTNINARLDKIENLKLPLGSPLKKARIVARGKDGSVVQLFMRRRSSGVCSRTTAVNLRGEVIISFSHSEKDKQYRAKVLGLDNLLENRGEQDAHTKKPVPTLPGLKKEPTQPESETSDSVKSETKDSTPSLKKSKVFAGLKDKKQNPKDPEATDKENETSPSTAEGGSSVRYLAGMGLVAILAAVAWWMKRKKKDPFAENFDTIEILSTKRLGAKQQLVLASVEGSKFLLAVSDGKINTLGVVPSETPRRMPINRQSFEQSPLSKALQEIQQVPAQTGAGAQPVAPCAPAANQHNTAAMNTGRSQSTNDATPASPADFGQQLQQALGVPTNTNTNTTTQNEQPNQANRPSPSNVAGLLALARARASASRFSRKPQAEA